MAFEESHKRQDKQTRYDEQLHREKERKIKEYQRPFLVALRIIKEEKEPTL
jgi:hypothetical protein